MSDEELVRQLRHLVSLNEPHMGGPYTGYAAQACVEAMGMAAERIETLSMELERSRSEHIADFVSRPWGR